ncbi:hypothetical protein SLA2020_306100 [Shorea laevis]
MVPGTLILKMWAFGDSSQSIRAVDPDHSLKIGGLKKNRLKGYPNMPSAIFDLGVEWYCNVQRIGIWFYVL